MKKERLLELAGVDLEQLTERHAFKRGVRGWIKARPSGGTAFTITFDKLEVLLKKNGSLREGETIDRVEVDNNGITVFIGGDVDMVQDPRV